MLICVSGSTLEDLRIQELGDDRSKKSTKAITSSSSAFGLRMFARTGSGWCGCRKDRRPTDLCFGKSEIFFRGD
jgi:hypothetical protein